MVLRRVFFSSSVRVLTRLQSGKIFAQLQSGKIIVKYFYAHLEHLHFSNLMNAALNVLLNIV